MRDFMLELIDIKKDYETGDTKVAALKGINLRFRDCEFVSILGQSGCGKTTMLNIIGGLDKYTSGDLRINGVSTKDYKDRDWDAYRNNSIGFVFQSYNLIPHQTVLSNVELALTLSGVSKAERRKRAVEALEKVGLGEQIHKKPNQMSGGQMQRVAIARALVNNSPCSRPLAFAITFFIPILTRLSVVRIDVSICSPIHTTATSQFCIPVALRLFLSSVCTT
jgi:putative ABC transport system permease protein